MPIAPAFTIAQTDTHVILEIAVPHIRVHREATQLVLTDRDSVVHFCSPPVYLLVLNFAPHRFRSIDQDEEEEQDEDRNNNPDDLSSPSSSSSSSPCKATFLPTVNHGTVRVELEKLIPSCKHWDNLDLIGRLKQKTTMKNNRITTSKWLQEIVSADEADDDDDVAANEDTATTAAALEPPPPHPHDAATTTTTTTTATETSVQPALPGGLYGFSRLFSGVFTDLARDGLAKEMLERPWTAADDILAAASTAAARLLQLDLTRTQQQQQQQQEDDCGGFGHGWNNSSSSNGTGTGTTAIIRQTSSLQLQRRKERVQLENETFCAERYLSDLDGLGDVDDDDDYIYQCAMAMEPHWIMTTTTTAPKEGEEPPSAQQLLPGSSNNNSNFFSPLERTALMAIPYPLLPPSILLSDNNDRNHNCSTTTTTTRKLCTGMLDLLFAYVYDHLVTDGDPTVESAWTVSILSASLSWLDDWMDDDDDDNDNSSSSSKYDSAVKSVVVSSMRRALVYPYIRTVDFGVYVWKQVRTVLRRGLRTVIRCLLQLRRILDRSEMYYLGNKLFVDPYLAWLQQYEDATASLEANHFRPMADMIEAILVPDDDDDVTTAETNTAKISNSLKDSLGFDLRRLEAQAMGDDGDNESTSDSSDDDDDDDDDKSKDSKGVNDTSSVSLEPPMSEPLSEEGTTVTEEKAKADDLSRILLDLHIGQGRSPLDLFRLSDELEGMTETPRAETESQQQCGDKKSPLIQEVE